MNYKVLFTLAVTALSLSPLTHAADCQPNNMGGQFCINDNGTTSDSMPNEIGGEDTLSSGGQLESTTSLGSGASQEMAGSTLSDDSTSPSTTSSSALRGRDWNSASNIQTDGAATSSSAITNTP